MKITLITIFFLSSFDIFGQTLYSARSSGLSGAGVILADAHSVSQNPAQNTAVRNTMISAGFESVFSIPGLNSMSCSFILPIKNSQAAAIHYARNGTKYFYDQSVMLSYGLRISPKLNLGAQIERRNKFYSSETDLAKSVWSATLGLSASPLQGFILGASISNPTKSKWNNSLSTDLPSVIRIGSSISLSAKAIVYTQVIKESEQAASYSAGIEYIPIEQFQFRTGFSSHPFRPSFGAGLVWKNTRIDFSMSAQSYLGFSPGISIQQKFR